jgi:predicted TIM-barrel fold metal-dependent hydrolase
MTIQGISVIDCHHHVGSVNAVARETTDSAPDEESESFQRAELEVRLQTMDELGVDQAILIPGHGYLRPNGNADTIAVNDGIAAYRDRHPDRFPAALGVVEPLHGPASIRELHRIKDELGLVGVSFHVRFQGVATNSGLVLSLAREMARIGLVPFVHSADASKDEDWWKVQEFADAVPEIPVVALDAFTSSEKSWEAVRVARQTPNIYFDTSVCAGLHFVLPVLEEVGPERIIFGTDQYSAAAPPGPSSRRNIIDQLAATDRVDAKAKRAILGGNLRRLLNLADQEG